MADSYFELIDETVSGSGVSGRFTATGHTVGPWSATLQHGGPPSALAITMAQRCVRHVTGRTDLGARRAAIDFVRAVPVAVVQVSTRVVRAARTAALLEASITSGGRECLSARVWFVREAPTSDVVRCSDEVRHPDPDDLPADGLGLSFGYGDSIDWRYVSGSIREPGPAAVWARATMPLVDGWQYGDLARVALVADSGSGVSAELDWATWSFVNVDLDVHLARPVVGEWILLDAATRLGPSGSALARSTISDVAGIAGAGLQTLVLAPLPPS